LQRTFITGCIFFQIIVLTSVSVAQTPSDTGLINHKLLKGIIAVESIATVTSLTGLSVLWYADYPHTSFHFINDNSEWLQMDKAGHLTTAYFITKTSY